MRGLRVEFDPEDVAPERVAVVRRRLTRALEKFKREIVGARPIPRPPVATAQQPRRVMCPRCGCKFPTGEVVS